MPHELDGCRRTYVDSSGDFTIPGAETHYPPDLDLEPKHLDIRLTLDIPARAARGHVTTTIVANRKGARKIVLQAHDLEDVVVTDEEGRGVTHRYDGREISVLWHEAFGDGESRRLKVAYRVRAPVSGLHFFVPDETYPDRALWVATDHETERARYWLPCIDYPAVRTTLDFHLTASEELTILANGLQQSEASNGNGTKTAHWHLDYPCPSYLICFAVGDFVRVDDTPVDGREIAYFCARGRGTEEDLMRSFGATPGIMEWLQKRVGNPFPFSKYFQFALPSFGGAMENITLVSWDDIFVNDETLHAELGDLVDAVNVHEMAHSYFGDAVVIRDFAHAWLKESWATYIEVCWREDVKDEDDFRHDLFSCGRAYMEEADQRYMRPIVTRVFNSSWDMYDRHLYPGGAFRLHMLRRLLGDEAFWSGVADYLATYSKKTVETEDFRRVLEAHSGRSLVKFFDQWIYGKGYPKLKVEFKHDAEKETGTFAITQEQVPEKEEGKGADGPGLFSFPLSIAYEVSEGSFERRTVEVVKRCHSFSFPMAEPPKQIRIDPDDSLLHRLDFNPGDEMLRRAVAHAPDAVGRILAAEELAKTGKRESFEAIREAYGAEPHYGARASMAKAVSETKSGAAVDLLSAFLETEKDPRTLRALARFAGPIRDERIGEALTSLLDREPPYLVARAALVALGQQRGEAHLPRLTEAAADVGFRGLVRAGALRGLAETRTEAAFALLRDRVGYGKETDDVSPHAAEALATAAVSLSRRFREQAVEDLADLVRDPRDRVRGAVARALGALGESAGVAALEALIPTLPEQSHPMVRRNIQKIRGEPGGKSVTTALKEQIERLEDRHRKLESRLDKLEGERQ